jgi:hypothetical protein
MKTGLNFDYFRNYQRFLRHILRKTVMIKHDLYEPSVLLPWSISPPPESARLPLACRPACLAGRRHAPLPLLAPSLSVSLIYDNLMYSRQTRRTIHYRAVEKGANFTSCRLIWVDLRQRPPPFSIPKYKKSSSL